MEGGFEKGMCFGREGERVEEEELPGGVAPLLLALDYRVRGWSTRYGVLFLGG